jgi:hypothetical protein
MLRLTTLSIACLSLVATPLRADTSLNQASSQPTDPEMATLRQTILAAANKEVRLETSPTRGLLEIMDHIDGEGGAHDRWSKLHCASADIDEGLRILVEDDLRIAARTVRDWKAAKLDGDPMSCKRHGDGAICRLGLGRDDGGPSDVELRFRSDRQAHWILETIVRTGWAIRSRRYINAHLRDPHVCR